MSQNVNISRRLEFVGDALEEANVFGPMLEAKIHYAYRFGIALDTTNDVAVSLPGSSDAIAVSEVQGGSVVITTGTADDDSCMMATPIIFSGTKKAIGEARIKISDVSGTALFVGFSDAKSEVNNSIAIHYAADTLTTVATDGTGFVCDADSATLGTSSLVCCGVKNNSDATTADTGINWADNETRTLRVVLDGTTARFYVNGIQKGIVANAVTAATLLCFTVQAMTRANDGSNTVTVTRMDIWQDE